MKRGLVCLILLIAIGTCLFPADDSRALENGLGLRIGYQDSPDQVVGGFHLTMADFMKNTLGGDLSSVVFEPLFLVGLGDDVVTMRASAFFKYAVNTNGKLTLFPFAGPTMFYWNSDFGDDFEFGVDIGCGLDFESFMIDFAFGLTDEVPDFFITLGYRL